MIIHRLISRWLEKFRPGSVFVYDELTYVITSTLEKCEDDYITYSVEVSPKWKWNFDGRFYFDFYNDYKDVEWLYIGN